MKNLKEVSSLRNCHENFNYYTYNYSMFKPRPENRNGLSNSRVKYYMDKIKKGEYNHSLSKISVQLDGLIDEGHHRFEALKRTNNMVVFTVVEPQTIVQISDFNSGPNSRWDKEASFGSAKTLGVPVVKNLDELRDKLCTKFNIQVSKLTASEMYGIMLKNTKHFGNGKHSPTVGMWMSDILVPLAKKREFKKNLTLYAQMKSELKNVRDAYKVCKYVMDLHFSDTVDFDLEVFTQRMFTEGFALDIYNATTIRDEALSMYRKQLRLITKSAA